MNFMRCEILRKGLGILVVMVVVANLTGCASSTRSMAESISLHNEKFKDPACQRSFELATLHDDIKLTRTIATPTILLLSGGSYLLPLIGANMGLDALDHLDASHVSQACGGFATPPENILEKVLIGAGFGILKK
jgi:hypothetical protein